MDELTVNDMGVDSALNLAVSREALTKSIEKEITAVRLADESATDLAEVRERLIKELEKQGPVIDYAKELSEQQLALIDSLKRQTQSSESVAKANDEQASGACKSNCVTAHE
jgi:lipoate-protein ligase A